MEFAGIRSWVSSPVGLELNAFLIGGGVFVRCVCEDLSINDSLQIGQNVMSEERPSQGSIRKNEANPSAAM